MRTGRLLPSALLCLGLALPASLNGCRCEDDDPADEMKESVEDAADSASEAVGDAAESLGD